MKKTENDKNDKKILEIKDPLSKKDLEIETIVCDEFLEEGSFIEIDLDVIDFVEKLKK